MTLKSVTSFLADLQNSGGPSSTNQYDLEFACGDKLKPFLKNQYDIDETRYNGLVVDMINETQIPGVSLTSQDIKQVHKGINMKPAVAKVYNEMDFSVILDITSDAFKFFTAWQQFIQGGDTHFEDPQKPSGKKSVATGHDGSSVAKSSIVNHKADMLKKPGHFIEVSGRIKDILLGKGVPMVTDEKTIKSPSARP